MFSTFDCAVKGYRQKEDAWNAIISGFMTGGCLAARSESLLFSCHVHVRGGSFVEGFSILRFLCVFHPRSFTDVSFFYFLGGPKAAFGSAVACGILLGVFEGVGVLLGRVFSEGTRPQLPPRECFLASHVCRHSHAYRLSTRVDVSTNVVTICYVVFMTCSPRHPYSL